MANLSPHQEQRPRPPGPAANQPAPALTTQRPARRGRTLLIVVGLAVIFLGLVWWINHRRAAANENPAAAGAPGGGRRRGGGGFGGMNGPLPVTVIPASKGSLNIYLNALGTVTPLHNVTVRSQISGQLQEIHFEEGQMVHRGDLLALVDPRPHEAALAQAEGQLHQAQSQLKIAQNDLARYETLVKQDSIAKQQVDTAQSQVNQYEGLVQSDQANIDTAKLNIAYCHITAPIDGRVGLRQVDAGNYVTPGDANGIATITQEKPISVIFTLPEDNINTVSDRLHSGAKLPVDAFDRTQTRKIAGGVLSTIDNQIDASTGTFKLRAEFSNDDENLFPNQFVNIRLLVDTVNDVVVVPNSAIERGPQGTYVYVVQEDQTVTAKPITLGASEGERIEVKSGVEIGDHIVIDGADKLKEGMKVIPQEPDHGGAPGNRPPGAGNGQHRRRNGAPGKNGGGKEEGHSNDGSPVSAPANGGGSKDGGAKE